MHKIVHFSQTKAYKMTQSKSHPLQNTLSRPDEGDNDTLRQVQEKIYRGPTQKWSVTKIIINKKQNYITSLNQSYSVNIRHIIAFL